ncbi:MAG TPA: hypothetical protein VMJ10_23110 [Kofleriaceae bacterium]|nr:hypothetical protein [Kofleriaceae bacterium]
MRTLWIVAIALAVACGKDKGGDNATGSAAPAPPPTPAAAPPPGPPVPPQPAPAPVQLGANGLPAECDDYKAAIDKLASCPKLAPDAKDSLVQAYQAASASWARLPAESRKNLAATCKAAVDAVVAAAKTQCGWESPKK